MWKFLISITNTFSNANIETTNIEISRIKILKYSLRAKYDEGSPTKSMFQLSVWKYESNSSKVSVCNVNVHLPKTDTLGSQTSIVTLAWKNERINLEHARYSWKIAVILWGNFLSSCQRSSGSTEKDKLSRILLNTELILGNP